MNRADIGIVIPILRFSELLAQCLESIRLSSGVNVHTAVVVNNAVDQVDLQPWKDQFSEVQWIVAGKNLGFSGGVNLGLSSVDAKNYCLLNDDTLVYPDTFLELCKSFDDPTVAIVGAKIYDPDKKTLQHCGGRLAENFLSSHIGSGELDQGQYDSPAKCEYVTGAAFGISGNYLKKNGLLSDAYFPGYYEETEYCLLAMKKGFHVLYNPAFRIVHFESQSFKKNSGFFFFHYHKNRLIFMMRNHFSLRKIYHFLKSEYRWLRDYRPKEQYPFLCKAYFYALFCYPLRAVMRVFR